MALHQVTTFTIGIGCLSILLGIADVGLALIRRGRQRLRNIVIGVGLAMVGILIIWLSLRSVAEYQIDLGPVIGKIWSLILVPLVFGLFILRGIMDIRRGRKDLRDENISQFMSGRAILRIAVAVVMIALSLTILALFAWSFLR